MSRASLSGVLLLAMLLFVGGWVVAQTPPVEPAIALSAQDAHLKWGGCPAFMPAGCSLAVLHGDPSGPNADVLLKVPPKAVIPDHWHTSAERMVLVAGEMHVTYQGRPKSILKPGMYAYGPAKVPHNGVCAGSVPCVLFIAFESAVDAFPAEAAK